MPLRQYLILKKAVDIESIALRISRVHDMAFAFSDPNKLIKQLEKERDSLLHNSDSSGSGNLQHTISWESDENAHEKLKKYMK